MKVRTRIILSFLTLGLFIILASAVAVVPIKTELEEIGHFHTGALFSIQSINSSLTEAVEESFAYVVSGVVEEKAEFFHWAGKFPQEAQTFFDLAQLDRPGKEKELALYNKIVSNHPLLLEQAQVMFVEYETIGSITPGTFEKYEETIDVLTHALGEFVKIEKAEVERYQQIALDTIDTSEKIIYGVGALAFLAAIGLGITVSRIISNPLIALKEGAARVGAGDFETRIEIESRDELGELADSFNQMAKDLQETVPKNYVNNILRTMTNCLIVLSPEGRITSVNKATVELLGYEEDALLDQPLESIVREKNVLHSIHAGKIRNTESVLTEKDGQSVPVLLSASKMRDSAGETTAFVLVAQDITERKQAEKMLKDTNLQLETILNSAGEGIYGVDLEGKITFINPAAELMLGYLSGELVGKPQHTMMHHSHTDVTPYLRDGCPIYKAFKDGLVHIVDTEVFWRKDGSSFPVEYTSTPIREDGKLTGAVVNFKDIIERKQAEAALRETHKKLLHSEKLGALGKLSADFAHEFNNPLTAVIRGLDHLASGLDQDENNQKLFHMVNKECVRMAGLVQKLLDFHKPSSGEKEYVDIHTLIDEMLLLQEPVLSQKSIKVEKHYAPQLLTAPVVPDQIKQVLLNLVKNAEEAIMSDEGIIIISTENTGDLIKIKIQDSGEGIPPENLASVFDPFFSTKKNYQGTGLGLSVSFGIAQAHGGDLSVESEPGAGAIFTLALPM